VLHAGGPPRLRAGPHVRPGDADTPMRPPRRRTHGLLRNIGAKAAAIAARPSPAPATPSEGQRPARRQPRVYERGLRLDGLIGQSEGYIAPPVADELPSSASSSAARTDDLRAG